MSYGLDKIPEREVTRLVKADCGDVSTYLASLKAKRDLQDNQFGSNKSNSARNVLELPPRVYWALVFKYGKKAVEDPKFRRELFDTWSVFRGCEKY